MVGLVAGGGVGGGMGDGGTTPLLSITTLRCSAGFRPGFAPCMKAPTRAETPFPANMDWIIACTFNARAHDRFSLKSSMPSILAKPCISIISPFAIVSANSSNLVCSAGVRKVSQLMAKRKRSPTMFPETGVQPAGLPIAAGPHARCRFRLARDYRCEKSACRVLLFTASAMLFASRS